LFGWRLFTIHIGVAYDARLGEVCLVDGILGVHAVAFPMVASRGRPVLDRCLADIAALVECAQLPLH